MRTVGDRIADVRLLQAAARAALADRETLLTAIAESTGLSPEGVALAFDRHVELDASDADLEKLVTCAGDAPLVAVVLSANVFVGALRAIALARAAAPRVLVRPSRRDPAFANALVSAVNALGDRAVVLDEALEVASLTEGEIHVYGRDETIADVKARARVKVRGHGSGMGVAWISASADLEAAAAGLADDVVVFDQRGCLSPRIALVHGDEARGAAFAEALHDALEERSSRVPRGQMPRADRSAGARYVATMTYACRALVGAEHAIGIAPPGAPLVLPPPYRYVHVAACASLEEARPLLAPLAAGIVTMGSDDLTAVRTIAPKTARISLLGFMQRPPLDGPVDLR